MKLADTLNLNSSLAEHAFTFTRVPDIETWHRRLGMHIDLSSEPAKC
jgi:hypothetical protein